MITGGSSGFGRAIAGAFARSRAKVIIAALDDGLLEPAVEALRSEGGDVRVGPLQQPRLPARRDRDAAGTRTQIRSVATTGIDGVRMLSNLGGLPGLFILIAMGAVIVSMRVGI